MKQFGSALDIHRDQVEHAVKQALIDAGDSPLYGMLRYFMGYEDEHFTPIPGSSGKRIRPTLLLYAADLFGGSATACDFAVGIELFHNFTLIHDDIEDNDELRRGRSTVWKVWGVDHAINAGDVQALLANKYLLRAAAADPVHGMTTACMMNDRFREVAEGQYLDFELSRWSLSDERVTATQYLDMVRKKTSVLLGAAVSAGGMSAGCSKEDAESLFAYGESLGMAYQIADDWSSIWGKVSDTGKASCGDVIERKKTYPVLYARDHTTSNRLVTLYAHNRPLDQKEVQEVVSLLAHCRAKEATRELGETYASAAKKYAEALRVPSAAQATLVRLVDTFVRFDA